MAGVALGVMGAAIGSEFGMAGVGWMIGSALGNALFPTDSGKPKLRDLKIQSSSFGVMLPIAYGNGVRLAGNLIWAGTPQKKTDSGKGGGTGSGNEYDVISLAFAVCQGEIAGFRRIWIDGTLYYDVGETSTPDQVRTQNLKGWSPSGAAPSTTAAGYGTGAPPPSIFGGGTGSLVSTPASPPATTSPPGGGHYTIFGSGPNALVNSTAVTPLSSGSFAFYYGTATQTPDGTMQGVIGSNCPSYRDTAYVVIQNFSLKNYGNAIPNFEFEVATYKSNVSDAVTDICNRAGLSSSQYDVSQLTSNPAAIDGYLLSGVAPARSALEPLAQTYFFDAVESDTGVKFVQRGGNSGVTFIDGDTGAEYETKHGETVDNVVITRVSETELPREVNVKFYDPGDYLHQSHRYSRRLAVHSQQKINQELPMALSNSHAQWVADQLLYTAWLSRTSFQWATGPNYMWLEPTDVVTLQKGNESYLVRIIKKDEEQKGKTNWQGVLEDPACYSVDPNTAKMPTPISISSSPSTDPGPMNSPLIFEPPLSVTGNTPELWVVTSGSQPDWGGCQVYTSYDNSNWLYAGAQQGNQPMGTLTAALASGSDPDSVNTLSVSLTESLGTLSSVTQSIADAFRNLAYVDGEIISWETATLTSTNNYNVTYLRRGVYGSQNRSHASGSVFASLNDPFRITINPGDIGKTVYLRFVPINNRSFATSSVSSQTSYSYVFTGVNTQVNPVTNLTINQVSNLDTATLNVSWTSSTTPDIVSNTVSYNNGGSWTSLPPVTGNSCQITGLVNGSYTIQVVTINAASVASSPASTTFTVSAPTVPNVANLALAGLTSGTTAFTGRDAKFTWNDLSTNTNFNDYQVQILDNLNNVLRTEFVRTNSYTYDLARNQQDNGPRRAFTIKVWMRGRQLQLSVAAATLSVTNPQVASLTGTTLTNNVNSIIVSLPAVSDPDWSGYLVYMSTTTGFTPSSANQVYQGNSSKITLMVPDYSTRYIKVAAYDQLGQDSLNYSAQISSTAQQVTQAMVAAGALDITKFASGITPVQIVSALPTSGMSTGQVVFLTTDNKLYRYNGSAWVNSMPFGDLTGSIAANQIVANTITGGMIQAGAIGATQIASGAITTDKLYVTNQGSALNADPACSDAAAWSSASNGGTFNIATVTDGQVGNTTIRSAVANTWVNGVNSIPIDPNKTYRIHCWARQSAGATGTFYLAVRLLDSSGASIAGSGTWWYYAASAVTLTTSWVEYHGLFGAGTGQTFPTNGRTMEPGVILSYITGTAAGYMEVQDVRIEEVLPGVLIQGGAITADKINVTSLSAMSANVGTVTAGIVQSTDGKTKFDLTNGLLSVSDGTRVRAEFGNLGGGGYGLELWDAAGNVFLNAGGVTNAPWASVTGSGKPADNATKNITTYGATAPTGPSDGDIWVDTSVTPNVSKIYKNSAWQVMANNTTNTNQLTDGAGLGTTSTWTGVTGTGKPADNADVTSANTAAGIANQGSFATMNKIPDTTQGTPSTYIGNLAVGSLHIQNNAISTYTTGSHIPPSGQVAASATMSYVVSMIPASGPMFAIPGNTAVVINFWLEWSADQNLNNKLTLYRSLDQNSTISPADTIVYSTYQYGGYNPISITEGDNTPSAGGGPWAYKMKLEYQNTAAVTANFAYNVCFWQLMWLLK